ncbi:MAG: hypothetical protein ABIL18_08690 [candidate division WOR-3 bacterium]
MGETIDEIKKRKIEEARKHKLKLVHLVKDKSGKQYYRDAEGNIYDLQMNLLRPVQSNQQQQSKIIVKPEQGLCTDYVKTEQRLCTDYVKPGQKQSEKINKKRGYVGYFDADFLQECRLLGVKPNKILAWAVVELRNRRIK